MLKFTVYGTSQPAGSKSAYALRKNGVPTGRVAVSDSNRKAMPWKQQVGARAAEAMNGAPLKVGPLRLTVRFYRKRPKGHYGSGANGHRVKRGSPAYPDVKPDLLKLTRAVEDALTGIVWRDDAQVVEQRLMKFYDDPERVEIEVLP